jgi:hypothetical protein
MKNKTTKEKGDQFEEFVLGIIQETVDTNAYITPRSGAGLEKGDLYSPGLNIKIECKDQKQLSMTQWIDQLKSENAGGHNIGMLVFNDPKAPEISPDPYCVLSLSDLTRIILDNNKVSVAPKEDNRQLTWKINSLVSAAKALIKELNK